MCCKNSDNQNRENGSAKKTEVVKDWILFFGDLAKASVDGVVEFWGKENSKEDAPAEVVARPEEDVVSVDGALETEVAEEVLEEDVIAPTAKELKALAKAMRREEKFAKKAERREEKLAKKEEKRARRAEKKEQDLLKKQENEQKKEARRQENLQRKEEKLQRQEEEKQERAREKQERETEKEKDREKEDRKAPRKRVWKKYICRSRILSPEEKDFARGFRLAAGPLHIVKVRVPLASVLRHDDGSRCKGENLGDMDFGIFDLRNRLRVLIEVKGIKRQNKQSPAKYRKVRRLCRKTGIPVVIFNVRKGVDADYFRDRIREYLRLL